MTGSSSARRALKLVRFRAPGSSTGRVCAVIWCEAQRVHLASPLVRASSGAVDPLPFIRQFPDAFEMGPLFERAMEWFDSICYAAANTREVQSACEAQPEWGLSCERYDGGDALLGLGGLTRHPEPLELLPLATMRYGLAETLQRILRADPLFQGAQLGLDPDAEVFGAEVVLERPRTVRVSLCAQVQPRDAVWHGVLEHSRLLHGDDVELSVLLILPRLQVGQAMRLTPRVVLAGLALEQVRHGLHLLVAGKAT